MESDTQSVRTEAVQREIDELQRRLSELLGTTTTALGEGTNTSATNIYQMTSAAVTSSFDSLMSMVTELTLKVRTLEQQSKTLIQVVSRYRSPLKCHLI